MGFIGGIMQDVVIKIPSRKKRSELIRKGAKGTYEKIMLRELESVVSRRLTEKAMISLIGLMWVMVAMYGKTELCAIFGLPLAVMTLAVGIWLV